MMKSHVQFTIHNVIQKKRFYITIKSDLISEVTVAHILFSDLTMEIVRYRLIGPLAHTVLTDTLHPASEVRDF